MLEWIKNLDPTVQAALIAGIAGIVVALINGKKKKDNIVSKDISTNRTNNGSNNVNMGEQNQDGSANVQNTYINCNIQSTQANDNDFDERIEKFMQEHTVTKEDIDKLFDDDTIPEDDTTEEKRITTIDNAVVVRMKNFAGGNTVLIGDEKTITEQIIKEHDEEVERALSEL